MMPVSTSDDSERRVAEALRAKREEAGETSEAPAEAAEPTGD